MDDQPGQVELLVGQPVGEVHLRERVGQRAVRAALAGQPRGVVVAGDERHPHAVVADTGEGGLGDPEGPVGGSGMVEDVSQPHHQIRPLIEGQVHRFLEGLLEVELALIDPALGGVRVVGPAQVGVAEGRNAHVLQPTRQVGLIPTM